MNDDNVIDIYEITTAKQVVKDVPKILELLDKQQDELYDYMCYQDVADVNVSINTAKVFLENHLRKSEKILKKDKK